MAREGRKEEQLQLDLQTWQYLRQAAALEPYARHLERMRDPAYVAELACAAGLTDDEARARYSA